jgi:outer membrane lipoprotein-sorting protein
MRPRWGAPPLAAALLLVGVAAHADSKSDAVIKKAITAAKSAKSLVATVEISSASGDQRSSTAASVRLLKPNFARLVMLGKTPQERMELVMTGKDTYMVMPSQKQYQRMQGMSNPSQSPLSSMGGPVLAAFFDGAMLKQIFDADSSVTYGGKKTVGKAVYETVVASRKEPAPMTFTAYFGPSGLCEGMVFVMSPPAAAAAEPGEPAPPALPSQKVSWWLRGMKLNAPMTAAQFAYRAPRGYTAMKQPEAPSYEKALVAVGKPAPDFNLPQPGGVNLALTDMLKEKKAVLINFWFYG